MIIIDIQYAYRVTGGLLQEQSGIGVLSYYINLSHCILLIQFVRLLFIKTYNNKYYYEFVKYIALFI